MQSSYSSFVISATILDIHYAGTCLFTFQALSSFCGRPKNEVVQGSQVVAELMPLLTSVG